MKKNGMKKLALTAALLIGVGCVWGGNVALQASAETVTLDSVTFKMDEGASVRKKEITKSGIRFTSYMTASDYSALMESTAYEKIEYGMLIAPIDYVDDGEEYELTYDSVFGANAKYYFNDYTGDKTNKREIINVYADEMTDYTFENDFNTYKAFKGVMINVKPENYLREFVGVGYIKATKADESVEYKFPSTDWQLNQRSIVYVSQVALEKGETDDYGALTAYVNAAKDIFGEYTVNHYKQTDNGNYAVADTDKLSDKKIGETVTATPKDYDGYTFAETVEGTKMTSTVYANGKTELSLYYTQNAPVEIEIATADDFMTKLAENPAGNYKLTANIDLTSVSLTKYNDKGSVYADEIKKVHANNGVAQVSSYLDTFSGTLDGNGYKITLNNSATKDSMFNVMGLFNYVEATGVIKNVYIDTTIQTYAKLGGAGNMPCTASFINWNMGTIENSYIKSVIRLNNAQADGSTHRATLIFQQNGTVKDTIVDFVAYNGTTTTKVETRAIFMGVTGEYDNVIAISASQPRFATNYLAGATSSSATPYTAYVYSGYSEMMAGDGKYFTTNTTGAATTVKAFENLDNTVFTTNAQNQILFFDTVIGEYVVIETIGSADDFMTKLAENPAGNYKLTADIDLTSKAMTQFEDLSDWKNNYGYTANNQLTKGTVWAYLNTFSGTLDGQGYKIILNNKRDSTNIVNALRDNIKGLFNEIASGAIIKNVYFDIDLYAYLLRSGISNQSYNALVAGVNRGAIENCYIDGTMTVFGHTNYTGEFTAKQLGTYVIGDQQGTVKDTLINYNVYLTRATNFTGGTLLETRAVFANFPGKAGGAVYSNVIVVSQSQTDYFGTYRYADGFRYLNEGTVANCYMYTSIDNLMAGNGLSCAKGVENGTATTVKAFENLTNSLWKNDNGTLYFGTFVLNA